MDRRKVFGHYIVGQGGDFRVKQLESHYGYERCLDLRLWYVVHLTGAIMGTYTDETYAISLAQGLEKRDQKKMAAEMEKVLLSDE